jgi:hypothetical protein
MGTQCIYGCMIDKRTRRCTLCDELHIPAPLIVRRTDTGCEAWEGDALPETPKVTCTCKDCGNVQDVYMEGYSDDMIQNYATLLGMNRTACCYSPMVLEISYPKMGL